MALAGLMGSGPDEAGPPARDALLDHLLGLRGGALPFVLELAVPDRASGPRTLALAVHYGVAFAAYRAAAEDYPGHGLVLRRGEQVYARSASALP